MQIIFGTKRLGKEDNASGAYQKYADKAVITLEGDRGKGKSRRFLFNEKAADILNLEKGEIQQLIFGTFVNGSEKAVLISNANDIVSLEGLTIYKTSKNPVAFDDSKEKGKAVTSSVLTGDIAEFLGLSSEESHEFTMVDLGSDQIDAQKLVLMGDDLPKVQNEVIDSVNELETAEELIANEPLDMDQFADNDAVPATPVVEGVNWDDEQPSQVLGLNRTRTIE